MGVGMSKKVKKPLHIGTIGALPLSNAVRKLEVIKYELTNSLNLDEHALTCNHLHAV